MELSRHTINVRDLFLSATNTGTRSNVTMSINIDLTLQLYNIFEQIANETFGDAASKAHLCFDQLTITLDSINDNMCKVESISLLNIIIYDSGLITMNYN